MRSSKRFTFSTRTSITSPGYAGVDAAIEATSNYYHIYETLSEHLAVTVVNPGKLKLIANSDKKTDRVDAKGLARLSRLESYLEVIETLTVEIKSLEERIEQRVSLLQRLNC